MSEELAGPGTGQCVEDPGAREERLAVHSVWGGSLGRCPGKDRGSDPPPTGEPSRRVNARGRLGFGQQGLVGTRAYSPKGQLLLQPLPYLLAGSSEDPQC